MSAAEQKPSPQAKNYHSTLLFSPNISLSLTHTFSVSTFLFYLFTVPVTRRLSWIEGSIVPEGKRKESRAKNILNFTNIFCLRSFYIANSLSRNIHISYLFRNDLFSIFSEIAFCISKHLKLASFNNILLCLVHITSFTPTTN